MEFHAVPHRSGGSLVVTIPKELVRRFRLKAGKPVHMIIAEPVDLRPIFGIWKDRNLPPTRQLIEESRSPKDYE